MNPSTRLHFIAVAPESSMHVRLLSRPSFYRPALLTLCITLASTAFAQINSTASTVTLNAIMPETLTIAATPAAVAFTLVPGATATAATPVVITTSWVLGSGRAAVVVDAYFAATSAALSGGSPVVNIPSSEIYGLVSTGTPTSYTAFTQSGVLGTAGAGLALFTQTLTSANRNANRTDNLMLQINLANQPQLPAGNYTGTLTLQAQAL